MIPEIGVLIAAYVFTRMFTLVVKPFPADSRAQQLLQVIVKGLAIVTMLIALVVGIDLALRGTTGVTLPELK